MRAPPTSVSDISGFPFESFEEFQAATREGRVRVWVRYEPVSVWNHSTPAERALQIGLSGSTFLVSIVSAVLALALHDMWLLWVVPAALVGYVAASPSPGLLSGGCIAIPLFAVGFAGSAMLNRSLFWAGAAAFVCWFLTSAGQGVADATIRDAMVQSEQSFLNLYRRRAITKVEAVGESEPAAGVVPEDRE